MLDTKILLMTSILYYFYNIFQASIRFLFLSIGKLSFDVCKSSNTNLKFPFSQKIIVITINLRIYPNQHNSPLERIPIPIIKVNPETRFSYYFSAPWASLMEYSIFNYLRFRAFYFQSKIIDFEVI